MTPLTITPTRRHFIAIAPLAGVALLAACSPKSEPPAVPVASPAPAPIPAAAPAPAPAAAPATASLPPLDEKDAQAQALGYVADAARADKTKYKNFIEGSKCDGCALYQGKAGDAAGPCPLFAGKAVSAQGWCGSWVKKA